MKMDGATVQTRYTIERHPRSTLYKHAVWRVMDGGSLICTCCYLKGAEALVEELCARDREATSLKALVKVGAI